jgi:hypothetical protein
MLFTHELLYRPEIEIYKYTSRTGYQTGLVRWRSGSSAPPKTKKAARLSGLCVWTLKPQLNNEGTKKPSRGQYLGVENQQNRFHPPGETLPTQNPVIAWLPGCESNCGFEVKRQKSSLPIAISFRSML